MRRKFNNNGRIVAYCILAILVIVSIFLVTSKIISNIDKMTPRTEVTISHDATFSTYTNDVLGKNHFSKKLIDLIDNAQYSIDIAIYSMDSTEIIDSLKSKASENVKITIITDPKKHDLLVSLFEVVPSNINIISNASKGTDYYMHHKFMITDFNMENSTLLTGSWNFSSLQDEFAPSYVLVTMEKEVIETFHNEFQILSQKTNSQKKFSSKGYSPFPQKINYANGFVEIWFSPGNKYVSAKKRLIELIDNANSSIKIMLWQLTDPDIVTSLHTAANRNVEITIITDDATIWLKDSLISDLLDIPNIEIVTDISRSLDVQNNYTETYNDINSFFHHHEAIFDNDVIFLGSANWSKKGFFDNDENFIVTNIDSILTDINQSFEINYSTLRNQQWDLEYSNHSIVGDTKNFAAVIINYNQNGSIYNLCFTGVISPDSPAHLEDDCNNILDIIILDNQNYTVGGKTIFITPPIS